MLSENILIHQTIQIGFAFVLPEDVSRHMLSRL